MLSFEAATEATGKELGVHEAIQIGLYSRAPVMVDSKQATPRATLNTVFSQSLSLIGRSHVSIISYHVKPRQKY